MLSIIGTLTLLVVGVFLALMGVQALAAVLLFRIWKREPGLVIIGAALSTLGGWLTYLACVNAPINIIYTGI